MRDPDETLDKIMKLFGLPKHTTSFSITAAVNEPVMVHCTYYAEPLTADDQGELLSLFSQYELHKKED